MKEDEEWGKIIPFPAKMEEPVDNSWADEVLQKVSGIPTPEELLAIAMAYIVQAMGELNKK